MKEPDKRILETFIRINPDEVLNEIEGSSVNEVGNLLEFISPEYRAILLSRMSRHKASRIIDNLETDRSAGFLKDISAANAVIILRQLEDSKRRKILLELPDQLAKSIDQMLSYPEDTAGAYIDPGVITLFENLTVKQALDIVKKEYEIVQSILFVLSRDQQLTGYIELSTLIAEDSEKSIRMVMNTEVPKVPAGMDIGVLIEGRYWLDRFNQIPVVDTKEIFLGVINRESLSGMDRKRGSATMQARQASMALGDLFQIGLTGIFRSASEIIWEDKPKNKEI